MVSVVKEGETQMKITKEMIDYIRFFCNEFVEDRVIVDVLKGYEHWKWDHEKAD